MPTTPPRRVFVVWDVTTQALKLMLQSLPREPGDAQWFDVPCLGPVGGDLLRDVVLRGLRQADGVLVVLGPPNANVGFELGAAVAMGKPVCLVHHAASLPAWLAKGPPFSGTYVNGVTEVDDILAVAGTPEAWSAPCPATPVPRSGPVLFVAPTSSEGSALHRRQAELAPTWQHPLRHGWSLWDLDRRFGDTRHLVWAIAPFMEGDSVRDGPENAVGAVLAGWFLVRAMAGGDALPDQLTVLRSARARVVQDVAVVEQVFDDLERFDALLGAVPASHPPPRPAHGELSVHHLVAGARALTRGEIHSKEESGKYIRKLYAPRPLERDLLGFIHKSTIVEQGAILVQRIQHQLVDELPPDPAQPAADPPPSDALKHGLERLLGAGDPRAFEEACAALSGLVSAEGRALIEHERHRARRAVRQALVVKDKAGSGKTNLVVRVAEQLLAEPDGPVPLLLSGNLDLSSGRPLEEIIGGRWLRALRGVGGVDTATLPSDPRDFIWGALETLAAANRELVLILDGINENPHLDRIDRGILTLLDDWRESPVRVIATCRDIFWTYFDGARWQPFLHGGSPVQLPQFGATQIDQVIAAYLNHFGITGELRGDAREQCRHPLLLRFFCEAHRGKNVGVRRTIRLKDLFEQYWGDKSREIAHGLGLGEDGTSVVDEAVGRMVLEMLMNGAQHLMLAQVPEVIGHNDVSSHQSIYRRLLDADVVIEELPVDDPRHVAASHKRVSFVYDAFFGYFAAFTLWNRKHWYRAEPAGICEGLVATVIAMPELEQLRGVAEFVVLMAEDVGAHREACATLALLGEDVLLEAVMPKLRDRGNWTEAVLRRLVVGLPLRADAVLELIGDPSDAPLFDRLVEVG